MIESNRKGKVMPNATLLSKVGSLAKSIDPEYFGRRSNVKAGAYLFEVDPDMFDVLVKDVL